MNKQNIKQLMDMRKDAERVALETVEAIHKYLESQHGKRTFADVTGMAKGFLWHAAAGIAVAVKSDTRGGERLYEKFAKAIEEFINEENEKDA